MGACYTNERLWKSGYLRMDDMHGHEATRFGFRLDYTIPTTEGLISVFS